jgi:hypothetical protein
MHRVSARPMTSLKLWNLRKNRRPSTSEEVRPERPPRLTRGLVIVAAVTAGISLTGCQVDVGGQTLPSGYYLQDDIQYFPAGPEFKLSKEAAAQKEFRDEQAGNDPACTSCR